jgi:hypothetical protein
VHVGVVFVGYRGSDFWKGAVIFDSLDKIEFHPAWGEGKWIIGVSGGVDLKKMVRTAYSLCGSSEKRRKGLSVKAAGVGKGETEAARAAEGQSRQIQRESKCMGRMRVKERRRW